MPFDSPKNNLGSVAEHIVQLGGNGYTNWTKEWNVPHNLLTMV
jgi:hypothetical protein